MNFNDDEKQHEINKSILATARSQLEQNKRLLDMIDEQNVQLDKIKIILKKPDDLFDAEKLQKIRQVLYP